MKSLATLIKLQKTQVDEQRMLLAKLQLRLEAITREIAEHEQRQEKERLAAQKDPELAVTYGEFIKWSIKRAQELERQRETAAKAVNIAREKLAELFEGQKRYEIAESNRLEEERLEQLRQETLYMDEVGSVAHERKMRKARKK